MPDVGDSVTPSVDVYTWDGSTAATLAVLDPDGAVTVGLNPVSQLVTVDVDGVSTQVQRWTVDPVLVGKAKQWVFVWTVTGTGGGVQSEKVWVEALPEPGGVAWRPTQVRVADYVPHRTVPEAFETAGEPINAFSDTTTPPAATVDRIIDGAVGWVLTSTGDLHESLAASAQEAAALRAAGFVELAGHPTVDQELARTLLAQADAALKALVLRNTSLTGVDPDDPDGVFEIAPPYSCSSYGDFLAP
jgi:hypothetical protein